MIDENGVFTAEFTEALPGMLGEEHAGSTTFDDIKDVQTLVKRFADTKSMVGRKLENVIQKPGENATDEDKAAYRAALQTELGAGENAEAYSFDRPDLPDGMEYNEGMEAEFKAVCAQAKIPVDMAKQIVDFFNNAQINAYNQQVEAEQKEFDESVAALKTDWAGEVLPQNLRIALKAVQEFFDEDSQKAFKDAKLFDNAEDLNLWRKLGFDPGQLRVWNAIGKRTLSAEQLKSEASGAVSRENETPRQQAMRLYPNSPSLWPKE